MYIESLLIMHAFLYTEKSIGYFPDHLHPKGSPQLFKIEDSAFSHM